MFIKPNRLSRVLWGSKASQLHILSLSSLL